ncbi:hypothetical protein BDV18DRAFT_70114 [Aspergillus unguis]
MALETPDIFSHGFSTEDVFGPPLQPVEADHVPTDSILDESLFLNMNSPSLVPCQGDSNLLHGPQQTNSGTSGRGKTRTAAANVLKRWFNNHRDNPYPTKGDKMSLADQSGLSVAQVTTWFSNTRRRRKAGFGHGPSLPTQPIDINRGLEASALMSPMERWRNSPPEAEAASFDAIMGAVMNSDEWQPEPKASYHSTPSDSRSIISSNASDSALSSASSAQSIGSHSSNGSFTRFYAVAPQRRRRRKRTAAFSKAKKPVQEPRPFQCTFCTDTFRTKYDWTRHEKTLHLSLESWTCCPNGPTYFSDVERCVFCNIPAPSNDHIESHNYSNCQDKPQVLRKFYRKDHLVQHLRLVHGIHQLLDGMNSWKSQVDSINSRCGLCNQTFHSWSVRNEHIAQHFREGALMKNWKGTRGLDPSVAAAVENAMPPYLIGLEATTPDPYSASRMSDTHMIVRDTTTRVAQPPGYIPSPFDCFSILLGDFVRKAQSAGNAITDSMIQATARLILFCDEDPWNQTPADNPEWLNLFKKAMGLDYTDEPCLLDTDLFPSFDHSSWTPWTLGDDPGAGATILDSEHADLPTLEQLDTADAALPPSLLDVNMARLRQYHNEMFPTDLPTEADPSETYLNGSSSCFMPPVIGQGPEPS